jgi:hypothetical protein
MKTTAEPDSESGGAVSGLWPSAATDDQITRVWSVLECSRGLLCVRAVWQERLGDDYPAFRSAFLQATSQQARSYPCPTKCGCAHLIHHLDSTSSWPNGDADPSDSRELVAACICEGGSSCPPVRVSPADLALWEVSWAKISRRLCRALDLRGQPDDLGIFNTRQVGVWSHDAIPVMLAIHSERSHFRAAILELIMRLRGKFILLAPTSRNVDALSQEMLARAGAAFFPLDRIVRLGADGMLDAREKPGVLFAAFSPQSPDLEADTARRAFALIQKLEGGAFPSVMRVFQLHCMDALSVREVARRCHCSPATIANRLAVIREKTGLEPGQLRAYSPHLQKAAETLDDSRARRIYRPSAISEEFDEEG